MEWTYRRANLIAVVCPERRRNVLDKGWIELKRLVERITNRAPGGRVRRRRGWRFGAGHGNTGGDELCDGESLVPDANPRIKGKEAERGD